MDDGRVVAVQVDQAAQNLPRPALHHLLINVLVPLAIPGAGTGRRQTSQRHETAGGRKRQREEGQEGAQQGRARGCSNLQAVPTSSSAPAFPCCPAKSPVKAHGTATSPNFPGSPERHPDPYNTGNTCSSRPQSTTGAQSGGSRTIWPTEQLHGGGELSSSSSGGGLPAHWRSVPLVNSSVMKLTV